MPISKRSIKKMDDEGARNYFLAPFFCALGECGMITVEMALIRNGYERYRY